MAQDDGVNTDRVRILSGDRENWFELSDAEPKGVADPVETYVFTVKLGELGASTRPLDAHAHTAANGKRLARLFAEMATQWRGWQDEMSWSSEAARFR